MTKTFIFEMSVHVDEEEAARLHGEKWLPAFLESGQEFADELKEWIDKHPFPAGCKIMGSPVTGEKIQP